MPDIPGGEGGLVVSFGQTNRYQSEQYNETGAGMGVESRTGILAPYIDRPVWSRSAWSDVFPRNHGFTDDLPAGQRYFTPDDLESPGLLVAAQIISPPINRSPSVRQTIEFVLPI